MRMYDNERMYSVGFTFTRRSLRISFRVTLNGCRENIKRVIGEDRGEDKST